MRHFTAAEAQGDLHLVAFVEEPFHGFHLGFVVVIVDARTQLDFLDLDHLLALARFGGFLLLRETELTVIKNLTDRRAGVRNDLNQVETRLFGVLQRFGYRGCAPILTFGIDKLNFADTDFPIGPGSFFLGTHGCFHWTANGKTPLVNKPDPGVTMTASTCFWQDRTRIENRVRRAGSQPWPCCQSVRNRE